MNLAEVLLIYSYFEKKITQITGLLGSRFFFFLFVIARKAKYVHF